MKRIIVTVIFLVFTLTNVNASEYNKLIEEGNRLWAENNIEGAQAAFEKAIQLNSKAPAAHARLAGLWLTNNQNKKAIKAYQNAISADPTNPALFVALGIAYLHEGAYSMSQAMVNQALALDPEHLNGKKLQEYVNKKMEIIAQTSTPTSKVPTELKSMVNPYQKSH